MKKYHKLLVLLSLFVTSIAIASIDIQIDHDEDDCVDGWVSMDVTVTVGDEEFDFDPSCSFSFDEDFETRAGVKCEVEAGMCSGFSPEERLEVSCEDGSSAYVDIECPEE